ncbi:MAG: NTP transferase domain-containing protein [Bacteroidales bacterium]|nr:NTP transferase domain-containing protein [Bacteroidales bacterium]
MKALIFAAGLGTRLRPLTDTMPKALVPVDGIPLLERVALKLVAAGYDDLVINIHHFAGQIRDFVASKNGFGVKVSFSDETDLLRETGGGIRHAAPLLEDSDGPFLVHNVDIISNLDLGWFRTQHRDGDLATILVSDRPTQRYFLFDGDGLLVGWTNIATGEIRSPWPGIDPDSCTKLAFAGIHLIDPSILPLMSDWPEKFSIVDFYLSICRTHPVRAAVMPGLELHDVGKLSELHCKIE